MDDPGNHTKRSFDDDDDEDEWEREALRSSRPGPPSNLAKLSSTLNAQNDELQSTIATLEDKLLGLRQTLMQVEKQLSEENRQIDEKSLDYDQVFSSMVDQAQEAFNDSKSAPSLCSHEGLWAEYLHADEQLELDVLHALEELHIQMLPSRNDGEETSEARSKGKGTDTEGDIEDLMARYRRAELQFLKTDAACKGYEAKILSFEKDLSKLNGLPQIIPILKSTTENYEAETRQKIRSQEDLQRKVVEPLLSKAAAIKIQAPLADAQLQSKLSALQQYSSNLEMVYNALLRQRSCQQFLSYGCEVDEHYFQRRLQILEVLSHELLEEKAEHEKGMNAVNGAGRHADLQDKKDEITMSSISELLQHAKPEILTTSRRRSLTDLSSLNKVNAVMQYEKRRTEEWSENFNVILDAAQVLDDTKNKLADKLFEHSATRDQLLMMPSKYTDLQSDLEFRVNELQEALGDLEKASKEDAEFLERKDLFSLFFTDPDAFAKLVSTTQNDRQTIT
ncbi:hypothetical protein VTP01DRAFT_8831 [Rhizomucor pusillus]|uniref:uncharacterized protein n=1 Tax=Rhizomucor pusillus TaxID=4840 RepID=UPI0037438276